MFSQEYQILHIYTILNPIILTLQIIHHLLHNNCPFRQIHAQKPFLIIARIIVQFNNKPILRLTSIHKLTTHCTT